MAAAIDTPVRQADVYKLQPGFVARGQRFFAQWLEAPMDAVAAARSEHEMILLLPGEAGATVRIDAVVTELPARSVTLLPPGPVAIEVAAGGHGILIASSRKDFAEDTACNATDYATEDSRVRPSDAGFRRNAPLSGPRTYLIDQIAAPASNPRLKMFQADTLSINWVEYRGVRDRTQLSPHSHADFEQGSLAIAGNFVHHLRVAWGKNANLWQADRHLEAPSPSILSIPLDLIHTTEGVGDGHHLLIDIFSPPRADFIEKGWVANADEYTAGHS